MGRHARILGVFGYLHFHIVAFWVHDMESWRSKQIALGVIWGLVALGLGVFGLGLGWL